MREENRFYNYIYLDPTKPIKYCIREFNITLDYEPFYVGKGTGKRINQHKYSCGRFMKSKLKSLNKNKITPIVLKIFDKLTNEEACINEEKLISIIGRRDLGLGPLVNLTNGGKSGVGYKMTIQTKEKLRKINLGKKLSKEHIQKIIESNKRSIRKSGINGDPIYQLDLYNKLIKEWPSASFASKILQIPQANIWKCLKGVRKTANKFKWKYKND